MNSQLESLLFERSWPLVATLAIGAVALLWHAKTRGDRRALRAAPVLSLAALAVWAMSTFITTDGERLKSLTRELVMATAPMKDQILAELLEPQSMVILSHGEMATQGQDKIIHGLKRATTIYAVKDHYLYRLESRMISEDKGQITFVVRSVLGQDFGDRPVRTEWLINWRRQADMKWKIQSIQWLSVDGQEPPSNILFW